MVLLSDWLNFQLSVIAAIPVGFESKTSWSSLQVLKFLDLQYEIKQNQQYSYSWKGWKQGKVFIVFFTFYFIRRIFLFYNICFQYLPILNRSFYFKTKAEALPWLCAGSASRGDKKSPQTPLTWGLGAFLGKSKLRKELFPLKFTAAQAKLSRNDSSAASSRASGGNLQAWEIKEQLLQPHASCEATPLLSPFSTSQILGMMERGWRMGGKRGCWGRKGIGDGTETSISCPCCQRVPGISWMLTQQPFECNSARESRSAGSRGQSRRCTALSQLTNLSPFRSGQWVTAHYGFRGHKLIKGEQSSAHPFKSVLLHGVLGSLWDPTCRASSQEPWTFPWSSNVTSSICTLCVKNAHKIFWLGK